MVKTESLIDIPETPYCYDETQRPKLESLSDRVKELRESGALSPEVLHRIRRFFHIKNIYNSNAIEGNTLDLGETRQVVERGLTLTGKPLKDQAEAKNLSEAIDYLEELASDDERGITERDVKQIHQLVLKGIDDENAGSYRNAEVEISGSDYKPPGPEELSPRMEEYGAWLQEASLPSEGPGALEGFLNAAVAHTWLATIHPFIDGNGRVARLVMNLLLMRYGYPLAIITQEDRHRYYDALEVSQATDLSPFLALLRESTLESLEEYERAAEQERERTEWAESIAGQFEAPERARVRNDYEVWNSAMDLLRSYFRDTAEAIDENTPLAQIFFDDFGELPFEKYMSLRTKRSAKKTWFFKVDFVRGEDSARYIFYFGTASQAVRDHCHVTLKLAREEPPDSYNYEDVWRLDGENLPDLTELGYLSDEERFIAQGLSGRTRTGRAEEIARSFYEEVVRKHFLR